MTPFVEALNVSKSFGAGELTSHVLRGVSCRIGPGELVLLCGPSGSGKTTMISILAGLLRPSGGEVTLCGSAISGMADAGIARIRREHLGFIFQTYNLFPALSALDNVAEILVMKRVPRARARAIAMAALERVGLGSKAQNRPGQLSGGQKQRVAIARAIAGNPPLIIGDEVTAALDTESAHRVTVLLREHVGPKSAVLLVTHDPRLEQHATRVIEMEDGNVICDRPARRQVA